MKICEINIAFYRFCNYENLKKKNCTNNTVSYYKKKKKKTVAVLKLYECNIRIFLTSIFRSPEAVVQGAIGRTRFY